MERTYVCIDLKSFYASVECVLRHLDPLKTNLVVADSSRTQKTICLAITPSLKQYGLGGRARLFEVVSKVKEVNNQRRKENNNHKFTSKSFDDDVLKNNKNVELDFIIAPPQMKCYMKYSSMIYNIYLKYVSSDDIFSYSVDEVFCDITEYLKYYKMDAKSLVEMMLNDVYKTTGITATAGIGTNMYLAKIAMDIVAKKMEPNEHGARIAFLDEISYRHELWNHTPITDFWSVGPGTRRRLENNKMYTMGDIALCSINNEKLLYKLFGVNAELLIDHAWGYEPCTIKSVKSYKPSTKSLSLGQVLFSPYNSEKAKLIVKEMTELIVLDMVSKHYMTNLITLSIGYDVENLLNERVRRSYKGKVVMDPYGRYIPASSHGSKRFEKRTSSTKIIMKSMLELFDEIINSKLTVRRINISVNNLKNENDCKSEVIYKQFDLFTSPEEIENNHIKENTDSESEHNLQHTVIELKNKFGKNAILKAIDLESGATTIIRNQIVGGHKG